MAIIPIYHQPDDIYRKSPVSKIYRGLEGASSTPGLSQPHRRAITVRIYDRDDILQHIISSNSGLGYLVQCRFETFDSGCGAFELELTRYYDLQHDWRVDIHLWNDPLPWYSGFIQERDTPGGTDRTFSYSGYGGTALFERVLVSKTYSGQKVHLIAKDLFQQAEMRLASRIIYDESLIGVSKFSTVGELKFLRTPLKDALKQVADLAGGFEYGVDDRRRMFFRKPSTQVDLHAWAGKHIETYVPKEDSSKIINKMFVKAGKVRIDIASTNPLYKTNWVAEPLEDKGTGSSQARFGVREGIYSAPSVFSLIDAIRAAAVDLKRKKEPRVWAKARSFVFNGVKLSTTGLARITGIRGVALILPKKKITHTIRGQKDMVEAELGDLERAPANIIADLAGRQALENLARQQSQNQL